MRIKVTLEDPEGKEADFLHNQGYPLEKRKFKLFTFIEVFPNPSLKDDVTIRMLSPVTIHSTLFSANDKKKTYYYSPFEEEFSQPGLRYV